MDDEVFSARDIDEHVEKFEEKSLLLSIQRKQYPQEMKVNLERKYADEGQILAKAKYGKVASRLANEDLNAAASELLKVAGFISRDIRMLPRKLSNYQPFTLKPPHISDFLMDHKCYDRIGKLIQRDSQLDYNESICSLAKDNVDENMIEVVNDGNPSGVFNLSSSQNPATLPPSSPVQSESPAIPTKRIRQGHSPSRIPTPLRRSSRSRVVHSPYK